MKWAEFLRIRLQIVAPPMSLLPDLKERFRRALADVADDTQSLLDLVRPSGDPKFGDYQANFAMPLGKRLGRPPRDVAAEIVARLEVDDFCHEPEIAGPGFINLRVKDDWLVEKLAAAVRDERLGIPTVAGPRRFVIDYSAPNVAKPMHVGHIRSTVIGNALVRILGFLGHRVIGDNHIGDWGTQFGMIIYGYKHFLDEPAYRENPVQELARLYRLVRRLMDYHEGRKKLPALEEKVARQEAWLEEQRNAAGREPDKKARKALQKLENGLEESRDELDALSGELAAVEADALLSKLVVEHPAIGSAVLAETAKLHVGNEENLRLWREFLPACEEEIDRIYRRLGVSFDHTLGESFYSDRLGAIVDELLEQGIARESDGAICVFLEGREVPMIVRKQDGAFLYATTDLATIRYRMEQFRPDAILYVVDHRQSLHFDQLFATARRLGYRDVELQHVSFGTVLGTDGRPFRTRAGDTVGLEGLLDEAVRRAAEIVAANDDAKPTGPEIPPPDRARIAERVGIAALKYADLSQNRTSDYVFSYDKMLAMQGNTATYMQYAYARVRSIFRKGG
ncbi:MAG TPA: arginine--tRNA ligase, partial [Thermoguttaceae bacterium]|nr:arginine--tRNA ligase [Thermoguttaceae bacterium]